MSGKWIKGPRLPKPHTCRTPFIWWRVSNGAVWKCDCGQQWLLTTVNSWNERDWIVVT